MQDEFDPPHDDLKMSEADLKAWEENLRNNSPEDWEIYLGIQSLLLQAEAPPNEQGHSLLSGSRIKYPEDDDSTETEPNSDPEGWRKYNDTIDQEQIDWWRRNPQYDYYNYVARYDARQAGIEKPEWEDD